MGFIFFSVVLLLGLLIALLAVPIELAFKIDRAEQIHGQVNIRWMFGLVRFSVDVPSSAKSNNKKKKKIKTESKAATKKKSMTHAKSSGSPKILTLLKQKKFRRHIIQFIKDLLRATHSHELYLYLRVGLGDPADTGLLWALLGPIAAMAKNIRSAVVRIEPEFMDPVFEIQSHGNFRLTPLEFIALTIAFVLSPTSIRAWRVIRQSNA